MGVSSCYIKWPYKALFRVSIVGAPASDDFKTLCSDGQAMMIMIASITYKSRTERDNKKPVFIPIDLLQPIKVDTLLVSSFMTIK